MTNIHRDYPIKPGDDVFVCYISDRGFRDDPPFINILPGSVVEPWMFRRLGLTTSVLWFPAAEGR
jgi:hypothetical protein